MPHSRIVRANQFSSEVPQSSEPLLVDFYADWCAPCRALAPLLDKVAAVYAGRLKVVKVNIDEAANLAQRYRICGIPAILFFQDGELVDRIEGLPDPRMLFHKLIGLTKSIAV